MTHFRYALNAAVRQITSVSATTHELQCCSLPIVFVVVSAAAAAED